MEEKVIVVYSCDAVMEAEPGVICVCTEEVAKKCYGYPEDNKCYCFEKFKIKRTWTKDEEIEED